MSNIIPRPEGHHVVVPSAVVPGAGKVINFLEKAFDGKVVDRYEGPGGVIYHAEVLLGDSVVMLAEPQPEFPAMPAALSFYVDKGEDVDTTYKRALEHGANSVSEPTDQPWGYRSACISDVSGNRWTICAIVEKLTHDEIAQRMASMPQAS